jgi:Co/Zn/Cd efflux system component
MRLRAGWKTASAVPQCYAQPLNLSLRKVVLFAAALNLSYFGIEFAVAHAIHSVSLFADSVDFLEDTSMNVLIFLTLGWSARARARLGSVLAGILLIPGLATLWTAWGNFHTHAVPDPKLLSVTALGALIVNLACALMLARVRNQGGSLTRAAFLSSRNDVLANVAIITTALVTLWVHSAWPDLITGLAIAALNADAAHEVFIAARTELKAQE